MQDPAVLKTALDDYFEAKARMFRNVPGFRLVTAGPLRGFHGHPNWPEQDAFYALDTEPEAVVAAVRAYQPHPQHRVTVFAETAGPFQATYAALGYRAEDGPGQPFMRLSLEGPAASDCRSIVRRVRTPDDLEFINSVRRVMEPAHLDDGMFRYFFIAQDGKPVCTGRYVRASPGGSYVAGLDTEAEYRRHGLATALLHATHSETVAEGATRSVLCSTQMALGLYRKAGYDVLTRMHAFDPVGA